jgi:uncharacterized protein
MIFDLRFLLLLIPAGAGLLARSWVKQIARRYHSVENRSGRTGVDTARHLLAANDLSGVEVVRVEGSLSDHYDSSAKILRLSGPVADERSLTALGIAAHEVAHAVQDAEAHPALRVRTRLGEPLAQLSRWGGLIFIGGFWIGIPVLMGLAGLLMAGLALFALVTLPVELNASKRAVGWLESSGLAATDELPLVRRVLRAAAFTYVVGLGQRVGIFLFLLIAVLAARAAI